MSETPASAGTPSTPNETAGADRKVQSRANSNVRFDDHVAMAEAEEAAKPKPKKTEPKKESKDEKPSKPKAKEREVSEGEEVEDDSHEGDEGGEANAGKPESKSPEESRDDKKDKEGDKKPPKAKAHKFRSGDETVSLKGDSVINVPISGKDTEVTLQSLVDNYSGKVAYDRKFTELDHREKAHAKAVSDLDTMANDLFSKSKENPEEAWDFLSELTGQDPVQIKMDILKGHIQHLEEYFALPEGAARETWLKDQERAFTDRKYSRRDAAEKQKKDNEAKTVQERRLREDYGISEEEFATAQRMASDYLKKQGSKEPATMRQILYANRFGMAMSAIESAVPHLANHEKLDSIVDDIVNDAMRDPTLTRERIEKLLREVWGTQEDDKAGLKRLGRKVGANVEQPKPTNSRGKEILTFADLD